MFVFWALSFYSPAPRLVFIARVQTHTHWTEGTHCAYDDARALTGEVSVWSELEVPSLQCFQQTEEFKNQDMFQCLSFRVCVLLLDGNGLTATDVNSPSEIGPLVSIPPTNLLPKMSVVPKLKKAEFQE